MPIDFTLPELGENITAGDVLRVLVKPGDTVVKDQPVLELETDKATIEVPSSVAGQVKEMKVKAGDKVKVGQAILSVEEQGARRPERQLPRPRPSPRLLRRPAPRDRPPPAAAAPARQPPPTTPRRSRSRPERRRHQPWRAAVRRPSRARGAPVAPAAPSVRRMARELGVDIDQVAGQRSSGRISIDDVKAHAKRLITATASAPAAVRLPRPPSRCRTSRDGARWSVQPMRGVRRKTARASERGLGHDPARHAARATPTSPTSRSCASGTRSRSRPLAATSR